jgi:hypothetical protein
MSIFNFGSDKREPIKKEEPKQEPISVTFFNWDDKPVPRYTSFVTRNASIIVERTTNQALETESEDSRDLKHGTNEKIIALIGDYSDQFKSAYEAKDIIRQHEAWRDDGIAAAALDFLIQFMLGDHFRTIIDINTEFDTEEEEDVALKRFSNDPRIKAYKKKIDRTNREVKFSTVLNSILNQGLVFGRACGLIEKNPIKGADYNLPQTIKILPSMHLGQVYVHPRTWNILAVEHKDFKFPASIIKADEMIYVPFRNHNMSPSTYHYGYSLFDRILDLSELNRIINQRNLKEINYRLWAPVLVINVPNSYNKDYMEKLKEQLRNGAGNSVIVNQPAQIETKEIGHDLNEMVDERKDNFREEIRHLQVPLILFEPDVTNRATSQEVMEAWNVSTLRNYRSWLKDVIQDQWINPILKQIISNERAGLGVEGEDSILPTKLSEPEQPERPNPEDNEPKGPKEPEEPQPDELLDIDKQEAQEERKRLERERLINTPLSDKEIIPVDAIDPATGEVLVYRLPWKIKVEFMPINFDTFKEKAQTAILLKQNGLATTERALDIIEMDDEKERQKLLDLEAERKAERFGQAFAESQNENNPPEERNDALKRAQQMNAREVAGEGRRRSLNIENQEKKLSEDLNKVTKIRKES